MDDCPECKRTGQENHRKENTIRVLAEEYNNVTDRTRDQSMEDRWRDLMYEIRKNHPEACTILRNAEHVRLPKWMENEGTKVADTL